MFKSIEEFKQFIEWAKDAGLDEAKVGEFSFKVSSYEQVNRIASIDRALQQEPEFADQLKNPRAQYIKDSTDDEDYEKTLFHSS